MSDMDDCEGIAVQINEAAKRVLGKTMPSRLQTITGQHLTKLMALVETMRAAGVDEDLVRHSVHALVASYEEELLDVMTSLARETFE